MVTEEVKFGFENLELWKKAREFKNEISKEARKWPSEEKFKLTDQVIRSEETLNYYKTKAKEIERLLNGYITYLRGQRDANKI